MARHAVTYDQAAQTSQERLRLTLAHAGAVFTYHGASVCAYHGAGTKTYLESLQPIIGLPWQSLGYPSPPGAHTQSRLWQGSPGLISAYTCATDAC